MRRRKPATGDARLKSTRAAHAAAHPASSEGRIFITNAEIEP